MSYEINVSKDGNHYFATNERSISSLDRATELVQRFEEIFSEEAGFKISVHKVEKTYQEINLKK
jgi:hypothetical protein